MLLNAQSHHLSIKERMSRVRERMRLERLSGIPVADKKGFLAFCREQEQSGLLVDAQRKPVEEEIDQDRTDWKDFGNWHDTMIV